MKLAEARALHPDLGAYLQERTNEDRVVQDELAKEFGVSRATIGYWMLREGLHTRYVALRAGETISIRRGR